MKKNDRRLFVKQSATGLAALLLPSHPKAANHQSSTKKNIVCVGGHPDDPETGCGGTLARLSTAGHNITIIYLTTGEAGIAGKSATEAAAIRKSEAQKASEILGAKPIFAGQIDGNTILNNEWVTTLKNLLDKEKPCIVFTHWPIDSHKDHQIAAILTIQAWMKSNQQYPLYFFEVCHGEQTIGFHPTDYVDITATQEQKRKSVFCHTSQNPDKIYSDTHDAMEHFRGMEIGAKAAEAFVRMNGKKGSLSEY